MSECRFIYFGHHKCASTWILAIISSICDQLGLRLAKYIDVAAKALLAVDFIADTGADISHLERLASTPFRGFHVIRDPRDVVVSAYFSHKYSHPLDSWLEEQRSLLHQVDLEEGIRLSIDFRAKQFREMKNWNYSHPDIYETRFEAITQTPLQEFGRVFHSLGLLPNPHLAEVLERVIEAHDYSRIAEGREKGDENIHHHYRKGVSGDWENFFSDRNKAYFKERYGPLLIDLGYEEDMEW